MPGRADRLTPLETLVMQSLWERSPSSVRQVRDRLAARKAMAYNTVLTVLRILREKGFAASERVGRCDEYRPLVTREQMARRSVRDTVQAFFAGSHAALVSSLLETEDLSAGELGRLRDEIDRRLLAEREPKT